jgi:hypothetical protein
MSTRIRAVSSRRVVERPRERASGEVLRVRIGDRCERRVVLQPVGEAVEEAVDGGVLDRAEQHRRVDGRGDRIPGGVTRRRRDMEELAARLVDEQRVASDEGRSEVRRYGHDAVAPEHDRLAGLQPFER